MLREKDRPLQLPNSETAKLTFERSGRGRPFHPGRGEGGGVMGEAEVKGKNEWKKF